MNLRRLLLWFVGLLGLGFAVWVYSVVKPHPAPQEKQEAWIPLPVNPMDASEFPVRELLLSGNEGPGHRDSLAWRCGSERDDRLGEEYILHIGDHAFVENGEQWKIRAIPHGSQIEVHITDHSFWNFSPPPPTASSTIAKPQSKSRTSVYWVDRPDLEAIRQVWASEDLWNSPQQYAGCLDGRPVFLEACVAGKYAGRSRNCDDGGDEATELWELVRAKFPSPKSTRSEQ